MSRFNDIPKDIISNRDEIEANFVFSLYRDILLYGDYANNIDAEVDFKLKESKFYYMLGYEMYLKGHNSINESALDLFVSDKEQIKNIYELYGGFKTIKDSMAIVDESNIEVFYDNLNKSNMMVDLYRKGFSIMKDLTMLQDMTSSEVYDYYEYILSDVAIKSVSKAQVVDLTKGYESCIKEWNEGCGLGMPVGFPLLNYHLKGIHPKTFNIHCAHIGKGKTTSLIPLYILPAIENGESVCIMINEQEEDDWRKMLLSTILSNRLDYFGLNRDRITIGDYTENQMEYILKALEYLKQYEGQIQLIPLEDYKTNNVKRIIKRQSKLGVGLFIFDTLKPEDESSDKSWGEFSKVASELFTTIRQEGASLIATAQLSPQTMSRKYLDISCIGKSKSIAETAETITMIREMQNEEKEKLQVYVYEEMGNEVIKKFIDLEPNRDYIILFIPKNRNGKSGVQLVYERDMSHNYFKELGYTNVDYDGF